MADELDLSSLASGPLPPLAGPGAARARGEQRRRRARALVASSTALLVIAGATTAISLTRDTGPHTLRVADTPTPSAAPSTTPSPEPTVEPSATQPTVGAELLLQPADAAFVAGGTWTARADDRDAFTRLAVCPTEDIGGVDGLVRTLHKEGADVLSQVVRFPDGSAAAALTSLRDAVQRCPSRPNDAEGRSTARFALQPSPAGDVVVVRSDYTDCETCSPVATYWVVVADLSHVSYVQVPEAEQPRLARWADAARFRLVCADPTCTRGTDPLMTDSQPLAADDRVRLDGIGPITVGMTLTEAEDAAGQAFTTFKDDLGNGCGFVAPRSGSPKITLMVVDGKAARVEVHPGSPTRTDRGIGIGSTEDEVEAAYPGRVVVRPHAYTDGHYLRVVSNDGRLVLVLETDGTRVTLIRSGTARAADYTEGCA